MIEKIARAIYKTTWGENNFPIGGNYERLEAIAQARAAIESIADLDPRIWIDACHEAGIALEDGEIFWRAAIRTILNERKEI